MQCRIVRGGQCAVQNSVQGSICSAGWYTGVSVKCRTVYKGSACSAGYSTGADPQCRMVCRGQHAVQDTVQGVCAVQDAVQGSK